jgi:hypothetical protein
MFSATTVSKYRLLPYFAGIAFAMLAPRADALSIQTASASGTLSGAAFLPVTLPSPVPGTVDLFYSPSSANSSAFFHTYGSVLPNSVTFGSRTSGQRQYDLTSPYRLRQDFTVLGSGPQTFVFSFVVDNGELSAHCAPCTGGGSANYTIDIGVDGVAVAGGHGQGQLTVATDGSTVLTHSGLALNGLAASGTTTGPAGSVSVDDTWNPTAFNLLLGTFVAGSSHTLSYDLVTMATGDFLLDTVCNTVQAAAIGTLGAIGGTCGLGNTTARSGDPFVLPATGIAGAGLHPQSVPEPASYALMGLGLSALVLSRRRKKLRR